LGQYSPFVYRGGLVLLSAATAAVVAAVACPGSLIGLILAWRPLRWIGVRSYGIYLWHYPVIVATTPPGAGVDLPRAAIQIAVSIGLAALSWRFIEEPVRHGALGRLWARRRGFARQAWPARLSGTAALAGGAAVLIVACAGLASPGLAPARGSAAALAAGVGLPGSSKSVTRVGPRSRFLGAGRCGPRAARWPTSATPPPTAWSRPTTCPTRPTGSRPATRTSASAPCAWTSRAAAPWSRCCPARSMASTPPGPCSGPVTAAAG